MLGLVWGEIQNSPIWVKLTVRGISASGPTDPSIPVLYFTPTKATPMIPASHDGLVADNGMSTHVNSNI
ncbi:unnamed protein product [Fusarium graminearum]|nr:unnamed protein product [Fusarium graminearum]CAG1964932.1 unnamed protein product [Fusarium graminearum]CAG1999149.1 unnamed protein product [Fusarium graminearum]VTO91851.1 unnamed protein product [Fusarium graminearum]